MDPAYYYSVRDVSFTKSVKFLYIALKFPLSNTASFYDIYSIISLSVPVNAPSANTTRIVNLALLLTNTHDGEYNTTLSHEVYSSCSSQELKH